MDRVSQGRFEGLDQKINDVLRDLLKQRPQAPMPDTLWHYTDGNGLLGIIQTGSLWATQISCLNDASEYSHGSSLLFKAFARSKKKHNENQELKVLFDVLSANEAHSKENPARFDSGWFVSCMSGIGNDLSQWRGYGRGEGGYAIGFTLNGLQEHQVRQAIYLGDEQNEDAQLLDSLSESICQMFQDYYLRENLTRSPAWAKEFLWEFRSHFEELGAVIKNDAFSGENEFRLLYSSDSEADRTKLCFRQSNTLLIRYLPIKFPVYFKNTSRELPISDIKIGPSRHQKASEASLKMLLRNTGYDSHVKISLSDIPFQQT